MGIGGGIKVHGHSSNADGGNELVGRSGASLVFIERKSISAAAELVFTNGINSEYDNYRLILSDVFASGAANLLLQYSIDGGASYISSALYDWASAIITTGVVTPSGSSIDTSISLQTSLPTTGALASSLILNLFRPALNGQNKFISWDRTGAQPGAVMRRSMGSGTHSGNTSPVNALRIFPSANLLSAVGSLYGYKNA